jgi:hypothetical protein
MFQTPVSGFPVGLPTVSDFSRKLAYPAGHSKHCPEKFTAAHEAWKGAATAEWTPKEVQLFSQTAAIWVFDGAHRLQVSLSLFYFECLSLKLILTFF